MALRVYQIFFLFVFSLTTSAALIQEGWERELNANYSSIIHLQHYNGKSYYMGTHFQANYYEAMSFCKHINMELLTIRSADENSKIWNLIKEARGINYWTSGTRLVDGKSWIWLPYGEKVDYTNWENGREERSYEKCLEVWTVGDNLRWTPGDCDNRNYFICERHHDSNGETRRFENS